MNNLCIFILPQQSLIFLLSLIQEMIFWQWKAEIFNWNPQKKLMDLVIKTTNPIGVNNKDGKEQFNTRWENINASYKETPISWKIYRFTLEFFGIFVG